MQSLEECVVVADETWVSSDEIDEVVRGGVIVRGGTKREWRGGSSVLI